MVRGRGGPGDEHALFDERLAWERHLGASGWNCVGWPKEHGGRGLSLHQQVIWFEEYARAGGPGRLGHIGEGLVGPTVMAFGNEDQQARFLPGIVAGTALWAQGYSEPNAGSDLANVATRAVPDGDDWLITGQKVWTSLAHWSDWVFVLARTDPDACAQAPRHLLLPDAAAPGRRGDPPDPPGHRHQRVQRGVLRRRPGARRRPRGRREQRLEGGHGHAGVRARRLHPRPADGVPQRARRRRGRGPRQRSHRRPGDPPAHRRRPTPVWRSCAGTPCACCRGPRVPAAPPP
jgi:hypothetical protein